MALTQVSSEGIKDAQVKTADILDANITTAKVADNAITGAKVADNLDIPDSNKIRFGTGNDLEIYHDGSNSIINDVGTGQLRICGDNAVVLRKAPTGDVYVLCNADGNVELYHDNSKKFETSSGGVTVTGNIYTDGNVNLTADNKKIRFGAGEDLQIYHDANNSWITNSTGQLKLKAVTAGTSVQMLGAGDEMMVQAIGNSAVQLYYDNVKKFQTESWGAQFFDDVKFDNPDTAGRDVTWSPTNDLMRWQDNTKATFGDGDDIQIFHDGTDSRIYNATGELIFRSGSYYFNNAAGDENIIKGTANGAVELYYNNSKKLQTESNGVRINGILKTSITSGQALTYGDNAQIHLGTGDDLKIYHDGTNSLIKNGTGILSLQGDDIRLLNNAASEAYLKASNNGAVQLFYDSSLKFETLSNGVKATGRVQVTDGNSFVAGDGDDLKIKHDGTHSYIENSTGNLYIDVAQGNDIRLRANNEEIIWGHGDGEVILYYNNGKRFETTGGGVLVEQSHNGYGGLKLDEFTSGNYGCNYILGRDDGAAAHVFKRGGRTQNQAPWADATGTEIARISRGGISFSGDTAEANTLQDYEEGDLSWQLRKSDNTSGGTNNGSVVKYTKVGRMVNVSGKIRTDSTSSSGSYVFHLDGTLPFSPSASGTAVIGHLRSQDDESGQLTASVAWMAGSSTVYIYTLDSQSNLTANENNVGASTMTNLVMTFSLTYQAS